jgi:hypothetical protein
MMKRIASDATVIEVLLLEDSPSELDNLVSLRAELRNNLSVPEAQTSPFVELPADLKFTLDQSATHSPSLHSLRNKLAVIIGRCDLLKEHLKGDSPSTEHLDVIKALTYSIAKNYAC